MPLTWAYIMSASDGNRTDAISSQTITTCAEIGVRLNNPGRNGNVRALVTSVLLRHVSKSRLWQAVEDAARHPLVQGTLSLVSSLIRSLRYPCQKRWRGSPSQLRSNRASC